MLPSFKKLSNAVTALFSAFSRSIICAFAPSVKYAHFTVGFFSPKSPVSKSHTKYALCVFSSNIRISEKSV